MTQHEDHADLTIGFIGQGWVGKNYADALEDRGHRIIRYALEEPYRANRDRIPGCDVVFIAVPTPSTPEGFDDQHVREALALVGKGKVAVIKSTIPPKTTRRLAEEHADKFIMHAPEFLREAYARYDVDNPERVLVGIPFDTPEYREHAERVLAVHPRGNYAKVTSAEEAEFIKYAHNTLGYATIVFANVLYDLAREHDVDWGGIKEAILNNPWFPSKYIDPEHKGGRGAGGHCFIKDFAALRELVERDLPNDRESIALLRAFEAKNNRLLRDSGKDLDLLRGVYGEDAA